MLPHSCAWSLSKLYMEEIKITGKTVTGSFCYLSFYVSSCSLLHPQRLASGNQQKSQPALQKDTPQESKTGYTQIPISSQCMNLSSSTTCGRTSSTLSPAARQKCTTTPGTTPILRWSVTSEVRTVEGPHAWPGQLPRQAQREMRVN